MADGPAVQDPDRLPWLSDTRRAKGPRDANPLLFWAFLAIVLVAGLAYWLGVRSAHEPEEFADILGQTPSVVGVPAPELTNEAVTALPPPGQPGQPIEAPGLRDIALVAESTAVPIPGVERARPAEPAPQPVPETQAAAAEPEAVEGATETVAETTAPAAVETVTAAVKPVVAPRPTPLKAWPADVSTNANGRVVRVGTFNSRLQAKQGWQRIVRVYPGMRRLRAVVVPNPSLRTGQMLYRLQFGTTSQAHSEILCQRMRIVAQSCVTIGLPPTRGARG
jgi:hypothetical protein